MGVRQIPILQHPHFLCRETPRQRPNQGVVAHFRMKVGVVKSRPASPMSGSRVTHLQEWQQCEVAMIQFITSCSMPIP